MKIKKQVGALKYLKSEEHHEKSIEGIFPKDLQNNEIKNEFKRLKNLSMKLLEKN